MKEIKKAQVVHETQAGEMTEAAVLSGLAGLRDSIRASLPRGPGAPSRAVHACRACGAFHRREAVICSEESCAKWLRERDEELSLRAETVLRGAEVIEDRRLT